jgi:TonB family protein
MKHLRVLLVLLFICFWLQTVRAQTADSWVNVSPVGEQFTIQMPNSPVVKSQQNNFDHFDLNGQTYTATSDEVDYTVWSFVDKGPASNGPPDIEAYLDACADLVWDSLLKPLRDRLPKSKRPMASMYYVSDLKSSKLPPGREYAITLGSKQGVTHFHVVGQQVYVLTVINAYADSATTQRFINSFALNIPGLPVAATLEVDPKLLPPSAGTGTGGGIGPGRGGGTAGSAPLTGVGGGTDYSRIFSPKDVTEKAHVLSKPEPQYTESARKYAVQGTVVLRAVFSSSGEVSYIRVWRGLPHGLTQRAISAARQIKFTPAVKDGHSVSMYIQLEYNFNLY